ncbi:hypothetical protein [Tessaracoccus coleopterorum]|uniref:hypothetical protein n=1 Tax=Tessaracoccus coleopterorum TaxID=2714950 RepID=UPI0018D3CCD2|nr:hypothetical protein [Tessaracoccus coleopterorum]
MTIAAVGALVPEALEAAAELGRRASGPRWSMSRARAASTAPGAAASPRDPERPLAAAGDSSVGVHPGRPLVTVQDAASHHLAWIGSALAAPSASLGVDAFGQSGSVPDLYAAHSLDAGSIVNASLGVLGL